MMYLTLSQAAQKLSISTDTLTRRLKCMYPDRPSFRGIRFTRDELPGLAEKLGLRLPEVPR